MTEDTDIEGDYYPAGLPKRLYDIWDETQDSVGERMPDSARESFCGQVWLLRDADRRVAEEGAIVSDAKGNTVAHPAISLSRQAGEEIRKWTKSYPPGY